MADETPTSKKLLEKQQRRAAEEERRREQQKAARKRNLVTLVIALAVLVLVATLVVQNRDEGGSVPSVGRGEAGCTEIEEHDIEGQEHVDVTPQYQTNPPTSGNHLQPPASPGFFDEAVDPGALVHNMEHGQIIFWYDPEAPADVLDALEEVVDQEFEASIAVPWDELESPHNFAMTAWGASQQCRDVSQSVVNAVREEYQGRGPENVGIKPFEAPEA
ncbi:MAG TPA: DUF3105 domain-containing protein [Actinomycetota bacterium]|nr:DUF3105 domain-containing protein [Actinomycetota bacterium]